MPDAFYERVKDYISMTPITMVIASQSCKGQLTEKPKRKISVLDINKADTAAFIALPALEVNYVHGLLNSETSLVGFIQLDQIGETYGLPDSTFQKLNLHFKLILIL